MKVKFEVRSAVRTRQVVALLVQMSCQQHLPGPLREAWSLPIREFSEEVIVRQT